MHRRCMPLTPRNERRTMNKTLKIYRRLSRLPCGKWFFSRALTLRAPYFATIHPRIQELGIGKSRVMIKDRRSIRNLLGTVNAGALCTLSELTGGLAVDASIPGNLRWIPKQMNVVYLKKAKGVLISTCKVDPKTLIPGDVGVNVKIADTSTATVLHARINFYISRRPTFKNGGNSCRTNK
jgi:acyl-coenzyme A thioesterase PaaI-like protein